MVGATRGNPHAAEYRARGVWTPRTLGSYVVERATERPGTLAVVEGARRLTYGEVWEAVRGVTGGLWRLGARPGAVVSYQLPNWAETVMVHHAAAVLGLVSNPIVPIYRHSEVAFIMAQARPAVVVVPHRFRGFDFVAMMEDLRREGRLDCPVVVVRPEGPLPPGFLPFEALAETPLDSAELTRERAQPDDVALLLYTSGTTASPKGVLHTHESLVYESRSIADLFRLDERDVVFMASPLTHITGVLYGLELPPMLGARVVLQPVWDPARGADLIEEEGATFTVGATPFLQGLVAEYERRNRSSALRVFACGGADVPPELVRRARAALDAVVVRVYGSTELPTYCCSGPGDPADKAAGTDGRPIGPVQGRVEDEAGRPLPPGAVGELVITGPDRFAGYLDPALNDEAFGADGWFRTGDLASVDAQGFVTIQGRKKDIVIRGGENISTKEVEDLLFEHPAVAEVAIVAMPDPDLGERACAYVVPAAGRTLAFDEMVRFLEGRRIARQKFPERLELRPEGLPKTASGKVQKFRLREEIKQRLAAERPVADRRVPGGQAAGRGRV